MLTDFEGYRDEVVRKLCDPDEHLRYVLTAVTNVSQERLDEDVLLLPRVVSADESPAQGDDYSNAANLISLKFMDDNEHESWMHYIFYGVPKPRRDRRYVTELLKVALDVAHELAHLILERGPGKLPCRIGKLSEDDMRNIREIEADWFAICVLLMYGFIFPMLNVPDGQSD